MISAIVEAGEGDDVFVLPNGSGTLDGGSGNDVLFVTAPAGQFELPSISSAVQELRRIGTDEVLRLLSIEQVIFDVSSDKASDSTPPVVLLIGANPLAAIEGRPFIDPGASVLDDVDAARLIAGSGAVDTSVVGTYTLTYSVSDAAGNAALPVTRTVNVVATLDFVPPDLDGDGVNDYREMQDNTDPNDANLFNPLSKGLVAYYPFDGSANDQSGYEHHLDTSLVNLVSNGDLSAGAEGFATDYNYRPEFNGANPSPGNFTLLGSVLTQNGDTIVERGGGGGLMMVLDGFTEAGWVLWEQTVEVQPGRDYRLKFWAAATFWNHNPVGWGDYAPIQLSVYVNGQIVEQEFIIDSPVGEWASFSTNWNAGEATSAVVRLEVSSTQYWGNDFVLDDISFAALRAPGEGSEASPGPDRFGKPAGAYFFDGQASLCSFRRAPAVEASEHAISAWVRTEDLRHSCLAGYVNALDGNDSGNLGYQLMTSWPEGTGKYVFLQGQASVQGGWAYAREDGQSVGDNRWHHVVGVKRDGVAYIYLNGVRQAETTSLPAVFGESSRIVVGWDGFSPKARGSIDDVRIYNRSLSDAEIRNLYFTEAGDLDSDGDGLTDAWELGYGRYRFIQSNLTWAEAKADAASRGGHLATITSEEEWQTIVREFGAGFAIGKECWIGATDEVSEGEWSWVTNEKFLFAKWRVGEPSAETPDQDYAAIFGDARVGQFGSPAIAGESWNDDYESAILTHYLLEFGYPTDPFNADTDGDGYDDKVESDAGSDPNNPLSTPEQLGDMQAPVITLSGANPLEMVVGGTFTDPGALVTDNVDAERTILGVGVVNTSVVGTYTLTYSASDAAGNTAVAVTRVVNVVAAPEPPPGVIHVSVDGDDASGSGAASAPFATLQKAIEVAQVGEVVLVGPGNYTGNFTLSTVGLTIRSRDGPARTRITSAARDSVFYITAEGAGTLIDGFTVTGGTGRPSPFSYGFDYYGGAIHAQASMEVRNCILTGNGFGTPRVNSCTFSGAIYSAGQSADVVLVVNCVLANNFAWASGGASLTERSTIIFDRCTIWGNTSTDFFGNQGGVSAAWSGKIVVRDSILWGNGGSQIGAFGGMYASGTTGELRYSTVQGAVGGGGLSAFTAGPGNLTDDPLLLAPAGGDFTLSVGSPARDAGDPAAPVDLDGTRADMGYRADRFGADTSSIVSIGFDSIPGMGNSPSAWVPEESRLSDQFLATYGVRFDSGAGYAAVAFHYPAPTQSPPNVLGGTTPDGRLAYKAPIVISFHDPTDPTRPAATDFVKIRGEMSPEGGANATMEVYSVDGQLLGSVTDFDSVEGLTLSLAMPGIHSIRLTQISGMGDYGTIGFDNLQFRRVVSSMVLAPVMNSATSASGRVGSAFTYTITASNLPTSFAAANLPAGLSVDTSTGRISGTPTTAGTFTVTLSATNSAGTGSAALVLTIASSGGGGGGGGGTTPAPVITSSINANGQVGTIFSYQIAASNSPTSYNASGLPSGLTVNTTTGLIGGVPTVAGTFTVTLSATNAGGTNTKALTLNVASAPTPVVDNEAPVIMLLGSSRLEIVQGQEFTDPGAKVIDNVDPNKTVYGSGTVDISTVGVYTLVYSAVDAAGNAAASRQREVVVVPDTPDFGDAQGAYLGNFTLEATDPGDLIRFNGQVALQLTSKKSFTGSCVIASKRVGIRGNFDDAGNAWVSVSSMATAGVSSLSLVLGRDNFGHRITGTIIIGGEQIGFVCLPAEFNGKMSVFPYDKGRINALTLAQGASNYALGHGYFTATFGPNAVMKFAGRLADGTAVTGTSRIVTDEVGDWRAPVCLTLSSVKGLLIGEGLLPREEQVDILSFYEDAPWKWARPANSRAKSFGAGFVEDLEVAGRWWNWTKGTNVLDGEENASFQVIVDPEDRNIEMTGSLDARNRPTWTGETPKGFRFKINASNGTFSGSLVVEPGAKPSSFYGILVSPSGVDLGLGTPVWGGGFTSTKDGSWPLEIMP